MINLYISNSRQKNFLKNSGMNFINILLSIVLITNLGFIKVIFLNMLSMIIWNLTSVVLTKKDFDMVTTCLKFKKNR